MNKTTNDTANASSMETLWKVLRFIGKYRFLLILSIILAAVSVILQLYVPVLFGNAIDQVVAEHDVNFSMMWYISRQEFLSWSSSPVSLPGS